MLIFVTFLSAAGFFEKKAQAEPAVEPAVQEEAPAELPAAQEESAEAVEASAVEPPAPFHRMKGAAWRPEQWWNFADGTGFAFSANIRFEAAPEGVVPVMSVWEEFDLSVSQRLPVFTVDGVSYVVASVLDEVFFPAGQWVKLGLSWDPEKKILLVSRDGKLHPVRKLADTPESSASDVVFDIFCDRLYPHALEREQVVRISSPGL